MNIDYYRKQLIRIEEIVDENTSLLAVLVAIFKVLLIIAYVELSKEDWHDNS